MSEPEYALISIVSEQPMPNVMAVLQDDRDFKHLEFIVSSVVKKDDNGNTIVEYNPKYDRIYQATKEFFESRGHIVDRLPPVDPYNLQEVMNVCQQGIEKHKKLGHEVVLNITGGTKLMSLPAYLCGLRNHVESIYIESGKRSLITLPPPDEFNLMAGSNVLKTEEKSFDEERFCKIDVPTYIALYGEKVKESQKLDEVDDKLVSQSLVIAQYYSLLRNYIRNLQAEMKPKRRKIQWPYSKRLEAITPDEEKALEVFAEQNILMWNTNQRELSLDRLQAEFLVFDGKWIEFFALYQLTKSNLFHDVRGNITIESSPGQWDVILTVNATLVIVECKSEANPSQHFGKINSMQRKLGGTYAKSFFVRSGMINENLNKLAKLYGISRVISMEELPDLVKIVANELGLKHEDTDK
jgi:hypothetical protein